MGCVFMEIIEEKSCCFIGHRKINETEELKQKLTEVIENLIVNENVDTFLFGSKSEFNDLCRYTVTELKKKYPCIKRIFVRAEYPYINDDYREYLLQFYEDTYYPEKVLNSGKASYVKRNIEMIDNSKFCVVYFDENYSPNNRNSGTKIAYEYAMKNNMYIVNIIDNLIQLLY